MQYTYTTTGTCAKIITFDKDENGIITKAFSNVKAAENPGKMLEEI